MYKIIIKNFEKKYLLEELIKIFLRPSEYKIVSENDNYNLNDVIIFNEENYNDKNLIKEQIYNTLSELTGEKPEWGILTGIRPVKLCGEIYEENNRSRHHTIKRLLEYYYLSPDKANMIMDMYLRQQAVIGSPEENSAGVYIGIPFCPTRCVYCSFASNQVNNQEIEKYLISLHKEIEFVGKRTRELGIKIESIYIGGGTPTTLTHSQLESLLGHIRKSFDLNSLKEFSLEAGRPDTITYEKLRVIKENGVDRISINPQSMKDETLKLIGRSHNSLDIINAFELAKEFDFNTINADIIAGLPGENLEDFNDTLKKVIQLNPNNITVHCLAVKRASKLVDLDKDYHYKQSKIASEMLASSRDILNENGYLPYYLYRQKHMAGAFENTGYSKNGTDCIYNVRIMEEHQTIIALGAGAITKAYYPSEDRLERVPNVTNYEHYISRIDEMLDRKEQNLFRR